MLKYFYLPLLFPSIFLHTRIIKQKYLREAAENYQPMRISNFVINVVFGKFRTKISFKCEKRLNKELTRIARVALLSIKKSMRAYLGWIIFRERITYKQVKCTPGQIPLSVPLGWSATNARRFPAGVMTPWVEWLMFAPMIRKAIDRASN